MMCKKKIESTAINIEGVKSATWNVQKQSLKVKFFSEKTTLEEIQKSVALNSSVSYPISAIDF